MKTIDLAKQTVRDLNQALHDQAAACTETEWEVLNPKGQHNLAVGLDQKLKVDIKGHAGYYCGGMNKEADIVVHGSAGQGVAENRPVLSWFVVMPVMRWVIHFMKFTSTSKVK